MQEQFIVSARKYRPHSFETVVGQEAITQTLQHAIDNNQLAQALLFNGPRGVGKTSCARILAKKINEANGASSSEDFAFNIFELDAASNNSVEDIRNLIEQVQYAPQIGAYKVYIIDEVHMLSQAAFNAFLKTLEEPPAHTIFILATTEKHKIIPTILSRCQIYDFKRISVKDIKNHLHNISEKEGVTADEYALHLIAQKADGALRDSLSIFDRIVSFSGKNITKKDVLENLNILDYDYYFKIVEAAYENNIPELLLLLNGILEKGFDTHLFISGLGSHFRNLLVAKEPTTLKLLEESDSVVTSYKEQANKVETPFILNALEICNDLDIHFKASKNQRLSVEIGLMKIGSLNQESLLKKKKFKIIAPHFFKSKKLQTPKHKIANTSITPTKVESVKNEVIAVSTSSTTIKKRLNLRERKSNFSIKSLMNDSASKVSDDTDEINLDKLPQAPFTKTDFEAYWKPFCQEMKLGSNPLLISLYTTLYEINGNEIIFKFASNSLMKEFDSHKGKFYGQLKKNLNNYHITFNYQVLELKNHSLLYTTKEKFNYLKEKNNSFLNLVDKLGLDKGF